jgi:O-acetyl-ADP-ribose deacetylase
MQVEWEGRLVRVLMGDITREAVDAIVTPATPRLVAGSGQIESTIYRNAGPRLLEELKRRFPDGCKPGTSILTTGGLLQQRQIIHAIAPRWNGGDYEENDQLRNTYAQALQLASEYQCHSIAIPCITPTGPLGYPLADAVTIAYEAIRSFQSDNGLPAEIRFVLPSKDLFDAYTKALHQYS